MANNYQNTSSQDPKQLNKSLNEDTASSNLDPNSWTHARNAITNSVTGDIGKIGNEPGNLFCNKAPYPIIGVVHLTADEWAIYSTDDVDSEIGFFKESTCEYRKIVNDKCLNFNRANLIKGVSRYTSDCSYKLYWADSLNPDRILDINDIPYIQICTDELGVNIATAPSGYDPIGCITCVDTPDLNCDKIRLASLMTPPCVKVSKGAGGGSLLNGTYIVSIAYSVNGQKLTDYFMPSNQQPLFEHDNIAGSIDIIVESIDRVNFEEFELVLISIINQQTVARKVGTYSTRQNLITLDAIRDTWPIVPLSDVSLRSIVYEKSDGIFNASDYLLRVGPRSKFDFNYQPLANQIVTKWTAVEYPASYYVNGGSNTGYMRDEVYSFFIRWVYDTGDKSSSYHIPGRPHLNFATLGYDETAIQNTDALPDEAGFNFTWLVQNTATHELPFTPTVLSDGGVEVASGYMGYWESTEEYPDNNPDMWNASAHCWSSLNPSSSCPVVPVPIIPYSGTQIDDYDLCGEKIRHHRFPDNFINDASNTFSDGSANHFNTNSPYFNGEAAIRIMGVKFENIIQPKDNDGNTISGIIGFEILRGTRQGNRSVLAKGIINNMGEYQIENFTYPGSRLGLYPNYPYNDVRPDPFLSTTKTRNTPCLFGAGGEVDYNAQQTFRKDIFSFHSPDTNFFKPYLSGKELKIYEEFRGTALGKFEFSEKHPKLKLLSNNGIVLSTVLGIALGTKKTNGERRYTWKGGNIPGVVTGGVEVATAGLSDLLQPLLVPIWTAGRTAAATYQAAVDTANSTTLGATAATFVANLIGQSSNFIFNSGVSTATIPAFANFLSDSPYREYETDFGDLDYQNGILAFAQGAFQTIYNITQSADVTLDLIRAMIRFRDYALKYNSHCLYDFAVPPPGPNSRRKQILNQQYTGPQLTDFSSDFTINNLYRTTHVSIEINGDFPFPTGDNTRQKASDVADLSDTDDITNGVDVLKDPTKSSFKTNSSCFYVGYKQRIRNQYGQIDSIIQVPVSVCPVVYDPTVVTGRLTSNQLFNGDIYIGRYTEKNTFFFFYEWLYDEPDGFEYNYLAHRMLPFPRYWLDSQKYEMSNFFTGLIDQLMAGTFNFAAALPSGLYNLDGPSCGIFTGPLGAKLRFGVAYSYFYLFNSGIRDFYVETDINIALRDWGELDTQKHYPILDVKTIFDTNIIKSGNYFKYDRSLSIASSYINYISWGNTQPRDYNAEIAENCYVYDPNQIIYSLPAQLESKRDNWLFFLVNNYKKFLSRPVSIKPINKNGVMIFFYNESPVQFLGVDQLQTDAGTKLTIGDGGLFSQPQQNIVSSDRPYEYGSCQDGLSISNTPAGIFWVSQNQGKIFKMQNGIEEITLKDLKWWFAAYLPYQLVLEFPNFELIDNPVIGIGCQSVYDNESMIVYFTKRDFVKKRDLPDGTTLTYVDKDNFLVNQFLPVKLGDPTYFEDASWTVSYDIKTESWVSWHDWHPNLFIPGKNTFISIKNTTTDPNFANGMWIHNKRCDLYCNYYGDNFPFEIEYVVNTGVTINTLRSIEYMMEVFRYGDNCYDRFHVLDFNFDDAVIYNTEQCSGLLKLNLTPKNNAPLIIQYPQITPNNIQILFSKEENKFRFNQFWDITDSRGEFPIGSPYPPISMVGTFAERLIWNTAVNGYIRTLNPNNLNYNKNELERKKFRHYSNYVFLRRNISGNRKMLFMVATNKNLYSPR